MMMERRSARSGLRGTGVAASAAAAVAIGILPLTIAVAAAQQAAPPPGQGQQQQMIIQPRLAPAEPAPAAAEPPPAEAVPANRPGFLDALGRWVEDSANAAKSGLDNARTVLGGLGGQAGGAAKDAADAASGAAQGVTSAAAGAAKGAADVVTRPLTSRFANGRERCIIAPNGAPDCRVAAERLCKNAGYTGGSSVDMQSAEKCPTRVYLTGVKKPTDCTMEHYVTRAMCQ
jgi:hypothetical protein